MSETTMGHELTRGRTGEEAAGRMDIRGDGYLSTALAGRSQCFSRARTTASATQS